MLTAAAPYWPGYYVTSVRRNLVVVRLDRLGRSLSHLLAVIEQFKASGAHFRSLCDAIDTITPRGCSPCRP